MLKIENKKYGFVHITKTGGTAFKLFLNKHYKKYFNIFEKMKHHEPRAKQVINPITIIRDPIERYKSIYNYWRFGSTQFKRKLDWDPDINSIHEFTQKLKTNWRDLTKRIDFTWEEHFLPQSEWLKNSDYKRTIVIQYQDDLNESLNSLLDYLKIEKDNKFVLKKYNVTNKKEEDLNEEDLNFVNDLYAEDFVLFESIKNKKHLFKKVI